MLLDETCPHGNSLGLNQCSQELSCSGFVSHLKIEMLNLQVIEVLSVTFSIFSQNLYALEVIATCFSRI